MVYPESRVGEKVDSCDRIVSGEIGGEVRHGVHTQGLPVHIEPLYLLHRRLDTPRLVEEARTILGIEV